MRLATFVLASCVSLLGFSIADPAGATINEKSVNLPAQELQLALQAFSKASGVHIIFISEDVKGRRASGVAGVFTPDETLRRILMGTGLTFRHLDDTTVSIIPIEQALERGAASSSYLSASPQSSQTSTEGDAQNTSSPGSTPMLPNGTAPTTQTTSPASSHASPTASHAKESDQLEEIHVTARRRDEDLNQVPISMTVLPQSTMDDLHVTSLSDLQDLVPGLYVSVPGGFGQDENTVTIRGISTSNNAPTTQFYIDETPIAIRGMSGAAASMSPQPLIFDLDRVEVLRGPQGTLFGASAMGGAIRFITPQPNLTDSAGVAKADMGFTQGGAPSYEIGAAYGSPIIDGELGFRVSAWYQSIGGFIDQEDPFSGSIIRKNINSPGSYVVRPAITFAPSENLTFTPSLFLQHTDNQAPNTYWNTLVPNSDSGRFVWGGQLQPKSDDLSVSALVIKYSSGALVFQSDTSYEHRYLQSFDDETQLFQYFTGYNDYLNPAVQNFRSYVEDFSNTNAWQQEFRLSSQDPSSRVGWVAGAYYRRASEGLKQGVTGDFDIVQGLVSGQTYPQANGNVPYYYQLGQPLAAWQDFHVVDISEALFGDVTLKIAERVRADIGVRIERLIVEGQDQVVAGPMNGIAYQNVVLPDARATPVTPRASITYQYSDAGNVYISAARGFRSGGGNPANAGNDPGCLPSLSLLGWKSAPTEFGSDNLWSYELGSKNYFFDRRLSLDASVFFIDWNNIQQNENLPSCGVDITINEGKLISKGVDLQLMALPFEGLKLAANVGYTDAYFPNENRTLPPVNPNTGQITGQGTIENFAGDPLPGLIPWTAAANAEYSHGTSSIWDGSRGYFRADWRWQGGTTNTNPAVPGYQAFFIPDPAYSVLNLRFGLKRGGWDLSAYLNNARNASPALHFLQLGETDPLIRLNTIQPRTGGLTAWYRF